jgi:hypothetical protein
MTWQQWQGDEVRARTSKTQALIDMPCHPVLKAHLEDCPSARRQGGQPTGAICVTGDGTPWPSDNALSGRCGGWSRPTRGCPTTARCTAALRRRGADGARAGRAMAAIRGGARAPHVQDGDEIRHRAAAGARGRRGDESACSSACIGSRPSSTFLRRSSAAAGGVKSWPGWCSAWCSRWCCCECSSLSAMLMALRSI